MHTLTIDTDIDQMVSYRRNVTGVDNVVFISPRGRARHGPRIKIAIDPPDSLNPDCETASITFDGEVVAGAVDAALLAQARAFLGRNHDVLLAYWNYSIDTAQLHQRLRKDDLSHLRHQDSPES